MYLCACHFLLKKFHTLFWDFIFICLQCVKLFISFNNNTHRCDKQTLNDLSRIPNLWYSCPQVLPTWVWDGLMTCFSRNRQRCPTKVYVCEILTSVLLSDSFYCLLSLHALMKKAVMLERNIGPPANKQLWTEALNPKVPKELNTANNHVSLEAGPFTIKPSNETPTPANTSLTAAGPDTRDPAKPFLASWPTETLRAKYVYFKLLKVWLYFCLVISN